MKATIFLIVSVASFITVFAQDAQEKHLLNDSWVRYKYETSGEVRLEFFDNTVMWKWLNNSNPDETARDEKLSDNEKLDAMPYRSHKIGDEIYVVNWYHEPSGTYVTIILNFKENLMCGSAILGAKEKNTSTIFDKGVIEDYNLTK